MAKVKDLLTVETRVSLFQTCINNSKGRTSKAIMKNAKEMYVIAIEDIQEFAGIEINKLGDLVDKRGPKRRIPHRKAQLSLLGDAFQATNGKKKKKKKQLKKPKKGKKK